jgi:hypothetical protein
MKNRIARFAATLLAVALVAVPVFAARGSADFTKFVAIGDSYGAGYENGSLNATHQVYSWPAIVARQAGKTLCAQTAVAADTCFAQPLVSFPGVGPELQLVSLAPSLVPAAGSGQPLMPTFGRPYNNLSVPGFTVGDVTTLTGATSQIDPAVAKTQVAQLVLRGLGTEVDQALAQQPTFIAIWIGGNDLLGAVGAGTPALLTPTATFSTQYNLMLDKLTAGAPNAGMVVGTLPTNAAALPLLSTVPSVLVDPATRKPVLDPTGKPIPLIADLGGGNFGQLPAGSFVLLSAAPKISTGYGIPAALAPLLPNLPNVGKPLSDNDVITPTEAAAMVARATEYNTVITTAAAARNIPVADIKGLFDNVASGHLFVGPFNLTGSYLTGGFFGYDGVHLTDIGYTLFANEYIKAINAGYSKHIPLASVAPFLQGNGAQFAFGAAGLSAAEVEVTPEAARSILWLVPQQTRPRFRAANH